MFGNVVLDKPEIKFKDYYLYRSYYCGLCCQLKQKYGNISRLSLGYDMTFLIILLSGLYDTETNHDTLARCIVHPFIKRGHRINEFTEYAADMNILLVYYKCIDDWNDEKKFTHWLYSKYLKRYFTKVRKKYPQKSAVISKALEEQKELENAGSSDYNKAADCFGRMTAEVFAYDNDIWEKDLRRMGLFLGKYIYLLDAYIDIEEDIKKKNYNPFIEYYHNDDFEEMVEDILQMMMAESARFFEMLPIDENMDILRNILYAGVWRNFESVREKRRKKNEEQKGI